MKNVMKYDVIIIGGGVVGCAVARELARYRLSIAVVEKTADICNGQSKANTAIVHAGYDAKPGTNKAKFNVLGNAMFEEISHELDVPFCRNGSLVVSFSPDGRPILEELLRRGLENGVEGLEILSEEALREKEPNIGSAAQGALWAPTGGITCPYELTIAYGENAAANGVKFLRETEVLSLERAVPFGEETPAGEPGAMGYAVRTNRGVDWANAVINCAGVHSDEINNMVSSERYSITPRRGQYYLLDKAYAGSFTGTVFQLPTEMGKGVLVAPTVDGTILIGPTAEDIEGKDDRRTTPEGLNSVLERARLTWEHIPPRGFITTFAGNRAHCHQDDFILGEAPDAPLFFNALGVESPGLTSAPAIGRHLAQLAAERLGAKPNPGFDPIRRGIPKFREMSEAQRAAAIQRDPDYAKVVCRCENVTEAEIRQAIRRPVGARTVDGIKRRTRAGMGRCQAGFCLSRTMEIISQELGMDETEVTKFGGDSRLVTGRIFDMDKEGGAQ